MGILNSNLNKCLEKATEIDRDTSINTLYTDKVAN